MKLSPSTSKEREYSNILASPNGKVLLATHPVIYGYRVSAFYDKSVGPECDWCAGDKHEDIERLYSIMKSILEQREESYNALDGIPTASMAKPFYNDFFFIEAVTRLAGPDLKLVFLPPMKEPLGTVGLILKLLEQ